MKKIYCNKCHKYGKFKKPEISNIFYKTLVLYNICDKCGSDDEKVFQEEESSEILKIVDLINNMDG